MSGTSYGGSKAKVTGHRSQFSVHVTVLHINSQHQKCVPALIILQKNCFRSRGTFGLVAHQCKKDI